jgi:hypothetical protein
VRCRQGDADIHVVLSPERAPNANAYAERVVWIKEEYLPRRGFRSELRISVGLLSTWGDNHGERHHQASTFAASRTWR